MAVSVDGSRPAMFEIPISYSREFSTAEVVVTDSYHLIAGERFKLCMSDATLSEAGRWRGSQHESNRYTLAFPETLGDYVFQYTEPHVVLHQAGAGFYLGIGPECELVRRFESVSLIRGFDVEKSMPRDKLVVGLGLGEFQSSCSNSLMRVDFVPHADFPGTSGVPCSIELKDVSSRAPEGREQVPKYVSFQGFDRVRLSRDIADQIAAEIQTLGGIAVNAHSFTNCSCEIVSQLPFIRVHVPTTDRDSVTISFSPDEYMRVEGESCQIVANPTDRDPFVINPLLLPDMNVRIIKTRIGLCRSG